MTSSNKGMVSYRHGDMVWTITTAIVVFFLLTGPVFGQFVVQPSLIELTPTPGEVIKTDIQLQNYYPESKMVEVQLLELTQQEGGPFVAIEPNSGADTSKRHSCKAWIKEISKSYTVPAVGVTPIPLVIRVPRGARGFYGAAVMAILRAPPSIGVSTVYKFVAPILIEVQGRAMPHKIDLADVGMEPARPAEGEVDSPGTTVVTARITNTGGTFCNLSASARVMRFEDGHWRQITMSEFRDRSIMPGVTLNLKSDTGRSLPSGKYRINGALYVDGRRVKMLRKEIDFVGAPGVVKALGDAPLFVDPMEFFMDSSPGSSRTGVIRVHNESDEAVKVETVLEVPPSFKGVALGDIEAIDLSCVEWVQAEPQAFTVGPGSQQAIRITASMPAEKTYAWYYAMLRMRAAYPDGQTAGVKSAYICVNNRKAGVAPAVQPMKLTLALQEKSEYIIVGRFWNIGNVHLTPSCRAMVMTPQGVTKTRMTLRGSAGSAGLLLPLGLRDFSGIMDFSSFGAGDYRLMAVVEYGPEQFVNNQLPIKVSAGDKGRKVVEIIKVEDYEKTVGVKWQ